MRLELGGFPKAEVADSNSAGGIGNRRITFRICDGLGFRRVCWKFEGLSAKSVCSEPLKLWNSLGHGFSSALARISRMTFRKLIFVVWQSTDTAFARWGQSYPKDRSRPLLVEIPVVDY